MPDLIDKYLGPANQTTREADRPASLLDKYLPPETKPEIDTTPKVVAPPISGLSKQESDKANVELLKVKPATVSDKVLSTILPTDLGAAIVKNYKGSVETFGEGLKDIRENKPASGVGKAALGALGAAISPVTGFIDEEITKPLVRASGNKEFGEKASFALTSGLPVAKLGQAGVKAMPSNKAVAAIVDTIGKDNLAPVILELKSNPRLSLMDVVPATRQMAQKLITNEGPHQNKFEKFVNERVATGKGATAEIYDNAMGVPVDIVERLDKFKKSARAVGKNEIEPALKGSGFVDVSGVINNIDTKLKPGVNSIISAGEPLALGDIEKPLAAVRKFIMDDKSVRTDPTSLHQFQAALRAKADDLLNSQSGQDRQQGYALMKVRNDIVEAIDKAADGKYKPALAKYKDEMDIQNAFNMGQLVTRNKLGRVEDSPEFWERWVKGASKEELEAAREGARLAVQHQISGFKAGARKGQDIVESEFNVEKLKQLFNPNQIATMIKELKDERNIAITNQKLLHDSQTAMRMKADSRVDLPVEKGSGLGAFMAPVAEIAVAGATGYPGASAVVLAGQLASKGKHKFDISQAKKRNTHITDLLTSTGEERDALIAILESQLPKPKSSMLQKAQTMALPVLPP